MAQLRIGDPLDKNTDVGAINSAEQLARIRELSDVGTAEGADAWSAPCELPAQGFWFRPTIFTGVSQAHRIAREEIFGPVLSVLTFRTPAEAIEKANNTPYGLSAGIWTDKGSRILAVAATAAGRRGLGEHVQQVRSDVAVRRIQGIRVRPRRWPPRLGGLPCPLRTRRRVSVEKTYKLFIGGAFPRSESGRVYAVTSASGEHLANAALASRKDVRDAVVAARAAVKGWSGTTAYNRGQILYRVAEMMEGRRDQFIAGVRAAEGGSKADAVASVDAAIDRWVWYAGWTDKIAQVYGNANPVAGPFFNLSSPGADRRGRRDRTARLVAAGPGQRRRAGDRGRQHRRRAGR